MCESVRQKLGHTNVDVFRCKLFFLAISCFKKKGLTLCSTRSIDQGKTWSALRPVEEPETEIDCAVYKVAKLDVKNARQSHDGYQLLVGDRIYLFYGWNKGSQPPKGEPISR